MSPPKQKETICALYGHYAVSMMILMEGDSGNGNGDNDDDVYADGDGDDDDGNSSCIASDYAWAGLQRAKGSEIIVSDE